MDTVIEWIIDEEHPANMVFLYYNEPDSAGHSYGTDDDRTIDVIKQSDERAGVLFQKLKDAEIYDLINIIVLADHGMQTVNRETIINTTPIIDRNLYQRLGSTPVYHILPKDLNDTDIIYDAFKAASHTNRFSVYRKEELTHLNYSQNRRIMPILLLADPGYGFENVNPNPNYGVHGYNPCFINMSVSVMRNFIHQNISKDICFQALFIAAGPQFKRGYVSQLPVNNIDLVPLFAKIMNVKDVPTDGTLERVELLLAPISNNSDIDGGAIRVKTYSVFILILLSIFVKVLV